MYIDLVENYLGLVVNGLEDVRVENRKTRLYAGAVYCAF